MNERRDAEDRALNSLRTPPASCVAHAAVTGREAGAGREVGLLVCEPTNSGTWLEADGRHIDLEALGTPAMTVDENGRALGATPAARALLSKHCISSWSLPGPLPASLWATCDGTPLGEAAEWSPGGDAPAVSVTRYSLGTDRYVLILREMEVVQDHLSRRLHQQRLEITGRLVAMIAHDLRVPLSSILFNADAGIERPLDTDETGMILRDIRAAADTIRTSIDGLLDFARLGAAQSSVVDLKAVVERVKSLLRPTMRDGGHHLMTDLEPATVFVRGNALVIEQVLVNLLINSIQAARAPVAVRIETKLTSGAQAPASMRRSTGEHVVCFTVHDDGPGIPPELTDQIFEPFFTTKDSGMGLGLPMAREALASIGSSLTLEPSPYGARFALWLQPAVEESALHS